MKKILFVFLLCLLSARVLAFDISTSVGLMGNYAFGDGAVLGSNSPGADLHGYVRFHRWFEAGLTVGYNRLLNSDENWIRMGAELGVPLFDEESKLDLVTRVGFGDSYTSGTTGGHGISLYGSLSARYWIWENWGLGVGGRGGHVFGVGGGPAFNFADVSFGPIFKF